MSGPLWGLGFSLLLLLHGVSAAVDYGAALTKSLLYFEAQRSGKLPANQRVQWRGDSGLQDGSAASVNLVGGYYDAGDNVKFGFPMAFTTTMLGWSAVDFRTQLLAKNEFNNTLDAIQWGADYIIKAHAEETVFYGQVGDGTADHDCWMRPEDMTTPRTTWRIDEGNPGSDLAAESAAALAVASIAFNESDLFYSNLLLGHSKKLFDFANSFRRRYHVSIEAAAKFYPSSGYLDELSWAAAWLYRATNEQRYLDLLSASGTGGLEYQFSWDKKYIGAQILVAKLVLEGKLDDTSPVWSEYWGFAEEFICNTAQKGRRNQRLTPGGLLWWDKFNNLQYTTASLFLVAMYSQYLVNVGSDLACYSGDVSPGELYNFVQKQADYILGSNPQNMSYMVGFGNKYPIKVHHRGASIVSIKKDPAPVACKDGFKNWYYKNQPNPNVLEGAIVGGPDANDGYKDSRAAYQESEPATANVAPFVGVLARLASP